MASGYFRKSSVQAFLHLQPKYIGSIDAGVHEQFGRALMRYNETLGGIPLCYSKFTVEGQTGMIQDDFPYIHILVK